MGVDSLRMIIEWLSSVWFRKLGYARKGKFFLRLSINAKKRQTIFLQSAVSLLNLLETTK